MCPVAPKTLALKVIFQLPSFKPQDVLSWSPKTTPIQKACLLPRKNEIDNQCKFDAWSRAPKAGVLGQPRGTGVLSCGGNGVQDVGTHVNLWLIHIAIWQKPSQYYKVIIFQLNKFFKKEWKHFYIPGYEEGYPNQTGGVSSAWFPLPQSLLTLNRSGNQDPSG